MLDQYPDLRPDDGTLQMRFLKDRGFSEPRRFIWDATLLTNSAVKTLNIRGVINSMERQVGIKALLDLNLWLSPKECQADPTRLSYACIKCADALAKLAPLESALDDNASATEKVDEDQLHAQVDEIKHSLVEELRAFDQLEFRPCNWAPAQPQTIPEHSEPA